jgi:hypothetical protein
MPDVTTQPTADDPAIGPPPAERPADTAARPDPRGDLLRLADALRARRSAQLLHEFLRLRRALRA